MENKKKKIRIRGRIFLYLLAFSGLLILTLWLLLTAFLGGIYRLAKRRQAAQAMKKINELVVSEDTKLTDLDEAAEDNEGSLLIVGTDGMLYYTSSNMFETFSTIAEIPAYYKAASDNGGSLTVYVRGDARKDGIPDFGTQYSDSGDDAADESAADEDAADEGGSDEESADESAADESAADMPDDVAPAFVPPGNFSPETMPSDDNSEEDSEPETDASDKTDDITALFRLDHPFRNASSESLISVKITEMDGQEVMLILTLLITPVEATVQTIRLVLAVVSVMVVLISMVIATLLSRHLSRPIVEMTEKAEQLAKADYSVTFPESDTRELSVLSETLNNTVQELKKTEKLQHELIANVSHDLRTPLTMIQGYAEMMRDIPGENSPENLQVVIDETERLNGLVTDLLDVSRMQANVTTLNRKDYCLTDSISRVLTRYEKLISGGYVIRFEKKERVMVNADEEKIFQVLYNLINNAVNYTDDSKEVTVSQEVLGDRVKISVHDNGLGINEEDLKHIWNRYYRSNESHKIAKVGTGLGLSIAKSVLELHGAEYGVESRSGEGSTFWFMLPVLKEQQE